MAVESGNQTHRSFAGLFYLNPAVAFAQDAKTFGETACPELLSITRKAIAGRRTHSAGIPAKAGIHAKKNAVIA
jgi:hypothetical protein